MKSVLEFEEKYRAILEDTTEWGYLRFKVGLYFKNRDNIEDSTKKSTWREKLHLLYRVKNIFYGFKNWFGRYEYLFFSDSLERREIDGEYKDKIMDDLIDRSQKSSLLLEKNSKGYKNIHTKQIVSDSTLFVLARVLSIVILNKDIKNKEQIETILKESKIDIDYKSTLKQMRVLQIVYTLLLRIYRPSKVFINCAYCRTPLVKACHKLNIEVVDVQHGVISKEHFGYVSTIKIDKSYIADELLSFGLNEHKIENLMIERVYPIGSYYLTYIENHFSLNGDISEIQKGYHYSIGISMQDEEWEYRAMIDILHKLAKEHQDTLFIIIPRRGEIEEMKEKNIIVLNSLDCYTIIMHCDIHMTLYSSCALEAPTLGIPNVLYDVKSMATNYYSDLLLPYHTKIISTTDEFYNAVVELKKLPKEDIKAHNSNVFMADYQKSLLAYFNQRRDECTN